MCVRVVNVRGLNTREGRAAVCYVGRPCRGWKGHRFANPYKPRSYGNGAASVEASESWRRSEVERVLSEYRDWLANRPDWELTQALVALWEECDHGAKPLGCWCTDATAGDGSPVVCHAQILAEMLVARFCTKETAQ